jgi:hypothetical protein
MGLDAKPFKAVIKGNANLLDSSVTTLMDVSVKGRPPLRIAAKKGGACESGRVAFHAVGAGASGYERVGARLKSMVRLGMGRGGRT